MAFSYANPDSGPSAGGIGWFDFGDFTITPGLAVNGLTGTLTNGITVSFDLTLSFLGGEPRDFIAIPSPSVPSAYFGTAGYTGIAGNVILYSGTGTANNLSNLTFSNIVVKDVFGNLMPNYTVILADGETTSGIPNFEESLSFTTNGGDWIQLAALGSNNPPVIVGSDQFIGFIGKTLPPNTAYVYSTQSPTQVIASLEEAQAITFQGIAIGFAVTQNQSYKNLTGRINDTDQFELQINDTPSNTADVIFTKVVDKSYAQPGDILTYSVTVNNPNNFAIDNVLITDSVPNGTTYIANSISSNVTFTGSPLTNITLTAPILPRDSAVITFKIQLGKEIPSSNPILNTAHVDYKYTVNPDFPNGVSASGSSNIASVNVIKASVKVAKTTDKSIAYVGDLLTYHVIVSNTGNVPADAVKITDALAFGTSYVPGSITGNVAFTGNPTTTIDLTNSLLPGDSAIFTFKTKINSIPVTNPIRNIANVSYQYTIDPSNPDGASGSAVSNGATTAVFTNNYSQQINDLIESIALQEAALAAITNAEGAKIQKFVAMPDVTPQMLLCLNKSVADMTDAITTLESILKQKLNAVECQINANCKQ